jgi:hypothetical protein
VQHQNTCMLQFLQFCNRDICHTNAWLVVNDLDSHLLF